MTQPYTLGLAASLATALSVLALPALAEPFTFIVANNSWDRMTRIELAPAGSGAWQVLAEGSQIDGAFANVTVPEPAADCRYDLRLSFTKGDGSEAVAERPDVDICAQDKPMDFNVYTFAP